MTPRTWTRTAPTQAGWYWWRSKSWLGPPMVREVTDRLLDPEHPHPFQGEWAGPLVPPPTMTDSQP